MFTPFKSTEDAMQTAETIFNEHQLDDIRELLSTEIPANLHELVQMANFCLDVVTCPQGIDEGVYAKANDTLINLLETFRRYGMLTCQNMSK